MRGPITSILVYTDGEVIGDGILRLSFAQTLKHAAPQVQITWLSSEYSVYDNALKAMATPIIDELIILPDRRLRLGDYLFRPRVLRRRRFDLVIDTQRNVKRTFWLKRLHHRLFISAAGKGMFSSVPLPESLSSHFLDRLLQLGSLAFEQPLKPSPLALPAGDWEAEAARLLPSGPRYIGFIIGAGHPDKCWPLEQFIALAQSVGEKSAPVIFLGPQEKAQEEILRAALPQAFFPLSDARAASPYLTIALGARLTAAVANDSGGGHLLAAADTPLVTLFRSASVQEKFSPRSLRYLALNPQQFEGASMADIPRDAVEAALNKLIAPASVT